MTSSQNSDYSSAIGQEKSFFDIGSDFGATFSLPGPGGSVDSAGFLQQEEESQPSLTNSGDHDSDREPHDQQIKKRKVDKDGFLTPATPDIPKSSCHYGESRSPETGNTDLDCNGTDSTESPIGQEPCEDEMPELHGTDSGLDLSSDLARMDPSVDMRVEDFVKNQAHEAKMLYLQWVPLFKESADFEQFCLTRLDKMITDARSLEENLKQQKDVLCRRLKALTQTLKMV